MSSFRVLFGEVMLRNIKQCTVAEAHLVSGPGIWYNKLGWALDEPDKFIGLILSRGILGKRGSPVESL